MPQMAAYEDAWLMQQRHSFQELHDIIQRLLMERKQLQEEREIRFMNDLVKGLEQVPTFEKIRWQSILAGTRTPDVEHKEKVKRGKELELVTVKVFGGAIDSGLEYLMRRNVQKAKEILDRILYEFYPSWLLLPDIVLTGIYRTTPVTQSPAEARHHAQPPHDVPQLAGQLSSHEALSAGGSISPPHAHVEKSSSPL
jgi:hypothetical protein